MTRKRTIPSTDMLKRSTVKLIMDSFIAVELWDVRKRLRAIFEEGETPETKPQLEILKERMDSLKEFAEHGWNADSKYWPTGTLVPYPVGDSMGTNVMLIAQQHGFVMDDADLYTTSPNYEDKWVEAHKFMEGKAPEGKWFGFNKEGSWGLWTNETEKQ